MNPHEALLSASGLRPMSAFVVVGTVVLSVAVWVVRLASGDSAQPDRERFEDGEQPAYAIAARDGQAIASFVPRFDLELSPRSLWQAHTPLGIASALSRVLAESGARGMPGTEELLAEMLPDADAAGVIQVDLWQLSPRQAQRIEDWIQDGAGTGLGRLQGVRVSPGPGGACRLSWEPVVLLSEEQRRSHGVSQAWRWARRIADGLDACRSDVPIDVSQLPESAARRRREEVWKALLPTAFARPIRGLPPDLVLPLRAELESQGVATWQMRIAYGRDRVYPAGDHELFGSWGYLDPAATTPVPREGIERLCDRMLGDPRYALFERRGERYRWIDDRPVRGTRANGYLGFTPASAAPVVRTTLDLALQRTLGRELLECLTTHQAALAMGIVLDVASGEILALDSAEAYPIQPFAPVYHVFTTGSTFKVVTMSVALEEGVVTPESELEVDSGEYRIRYPDGRASGRVIREAEGALTGRHTAAEFFAFSVNAALAQIGLRVDDRRFRGYLERLGYGRAPASGLGPERAGNLPETPWSYAYTHASIGFGHEISTTLWRHAEALATVIRGGVRRPLTLLGSVEQGARSVPVPRGEPERIFSEETCAKVRAMMRLGAERGTGREVKAAFLRSLTRAGGAEPAADSFDIGTKTGTAQKVPSEVCVHVELAERARWEREGLPATRERIDSLSHLEKPHARCYTSSICIFGKVPGSERELMVLIVVDEPCGKERFGSRVAGPTAQRVLAEALGLTRNGCPPSPDVVEGFTTSALALRSPSDEPWRGRP